MTPLDSSQTKKESACKAPGDASVGGGIREASPATDDTNAAAAGIGESATMSARRAANTSPSFMAADSLMLRIASNDGAVVSRGAHAGPGRSLNRPRGQRNRWSL